jgi:hypothetical protein
MHVLLLFSFASGRLVVFATRMGLAATLPGSEFLDILTA